MTEEYKPTASGKELVKAGVSVMVSLLTSATKERIESYV